MSIQNRRRVPGAASPAPVSPVRSTTHGVAARWLPIAAAVAGPLFLVSSGIQAITREGFDLRLHPLSQLSTGEHGWIQILTFAMTGLALLTLALLHRRAVTDGVGRRAVPVLLATGGAAFVLAGVFVMDPQHGFPAGAPAGPAPEMSWHGVAHSAAAAVAFTALAVAAVVLVVRAARARRVPAAIGHGVVALVLLLPVSPEGASLQIAFNGLVAFTWTTVLALRLHRPAGA